MEVSPELTTEFLGILNNQELSANDRAQALVDLQGKALAQAAEAQTKAWTTLQDEWQGKVKADPEIGGAKLQDTLASVGKLVTEYGTDELREALDVTGAGNHPAVVKFFAKMASRLTEGSAVPGNPAGQGQSLAEKMYPTMTKGN